MSDLYHEDEKIITGYDPEILRRLLSFLKPHRLAMIGAIIALIIASGAELGMPIIIQRAVDQHLITNYVRIPTTEGENELLAAVDITEAPVIGDYYYLLESDLTSISGVDRTALKKKEIISTTVFYIFPVNRTTIAVIESYPDTITRGTTYAAVRKTDLDTFTGRELSTIRSHDMEGIRSKIFIFLGLLCTIFVFMFLEVVLMALTGQAVMKDLRTRLFDHIIRQSLRFLNAEPVGRLVTRLTNDVETINELFTQVLASLMKNVVMMVGVVITLFLIDPLLAAVTMATLPPVTLITAVFRKRARDAFRSVRRWVSRVNAFLAEHISGMPVIHIFVQEERIDREFDEQNTQLMKANLGEMYVFAVFRPLIDLLSSISIAVIIYFGAFFLLKGFVSLGILVAFIDLIRRFYQQLMQISERFVIVQSAFAGSERVFSLLDQKDTISDTGTRSWPAASEKPTDAGEVVFDHVCFSYKPGEPVIKDISFRIAPGETVAVVGYTGAGKTTLANLLTRLWDVDSGSITVGGTDIRDIPLSQLRTRIQSIQQDVFLFHDTIEENIRLGKEIPEAQLIEAAVAVQADHFIRNLSRGYKTELEEGAVNISTGERQLLAFARVIAHNPSIIILDEATSSIDTETEHLIQKALKILLKGRTSLVIAHRLSTIKHSDRIIVLSGGKIVEQGTHEQLVAEGGLYFNLYKLQYAGRPS